MSKQPPATPATPATTPAADGADAVRVYRRLLGYALPHWRMFLVGVLGMAMFAAVDSAFAWLVSRFLDETFVERNRAVLLWLPIGIVGLFLFRGIGDYLGSYGLGWVGRQVIKGIRVDLFRHYLDLPASFYDRSGAAALLSRLTYNTELVAEAVTNGVSVLVRDTLTIIGLLGWLLYTNWRLTLFALAVAPLIGWMINWINRAFRRYSARIQNSMGDVTRVAKEAIEGQRLVKVFNAQEYEAKQFEAVAEGNRYQNMKLVQARASATPVVQLVSSIALALVMYVAVGDVLAQGMSVGTFTGFLAGLLLVTAPVRRLAQVFGPLQQGIAAGQSVFEILDEPKEDAGGERTLERARGEVEFRDVTFSYPGKAPAVHGVSFRVPAGSRVAIVGLSGSGKSTLVGLVPRFYDAASGQVLVDGVDVREYRLRDLRENVALVSQEVVLLHGSIRDNIVFSTKNATPERVEAAARAAHVLEFALEQFGGLDAPVGDRGGLLSGGQRQRIAIARALLKDAPILILDEAMSALDTASERIIQTALEELMANRTTLVIAHRLSTIETADLIVVMEEGRVIESGAHAELIARGGRYAQLHRMQFNA